MGYTHHIHRMKKHKLYPVYHNMITRCYVNKSWNKHWKSYGARGIKVCDEWRNHPKSFFEWAIASGWKSGDYLDRENNHGDYTPDNCRWVTPVVSARNRRSTKLTLPDAAVIYDLARKGVPQILIGALYGVTFQTVSNVKRGVCWPDAKNYAWSEA